MVGLHGFKVKNNYTCAKGEPGEATILPCEIKFRYGIHCKNLRVVLTFLWLSQLQQKYNYILLLLRYVSLLCSFGTPC